MKTMTIILCAAGLALAVGLAAAAAAHGGSGGHGGHGPHAAEGALAVPEMVAWLVDQALDGPGVSDEQRGRVLAVKDRVMSQAEALHAEHAATHEEFKRQWDAEKMDAARLHSLVDARMEELRRVLHTAVDGVVEVHDTLTPDQRRALTARLEAMHGEK